MGRSQHEEKLAVECGYWHLYRFNPALAEEGKNPFTLDSKEPDWSKFQEFIKGEVRYSSLMRQLRSSSTRPSSTPRSATSPTRDWLSNGYSGKSTEIPAGAHAHPPEF